MSSYTAIFGEAPPTEEPSSQPKGVTITRQDLERDYPSTAADQSWEYDPPGVGARSTQQINIDWSKFENHTFFHSAEVKVNAAYERMVNHFPYDGSLKDISDFIASLNGWEKYVLDQFPKYLGYLNFNSSIFISIKDSEGYLFPTLAKRNTLRSVLGTDSAKSGYTLECFVNPPSGSSNTKNQVLFQKISADSNNGITLALSNSLSTSPTIEVHSLLTSGSGNNVYVLHASASIPKGEFSHIATVFDKDRTNTLSILKNGVLQDTSISALEIDTLDFAQSDILIGTGSNHVTGSTGLAEKSGIFLAEELLTGSVDELRFWTYPKTFSDISSSIEYPAENTNNLGLYLKFNEPTGSYASNNIVLDSSGNGLHGYITNYANTNRIVESSIPMKYELSAHNPVLFPDYPSLTARNISLLTSASNYDVVNPNNILKLVPQHYLEGDLVQPEDPTILPEYTSSISVPGGGLMPSNQIIAHFLLMWAAFFDDLKLHIDTFSDMAALNYMDIDGIPEQAIMQVAKQYGYDLPNMFADASAEQFHLGRNLTENQVYSEKTLKQILFSIWRRVTAEIPHISRSKGTLSSITMLLNSFGMDANSNFRIREFGSSPVRTVTNLRKEKKKPINFINFNTGSTMYMTSSNLLAYRWEPGAPIFTDVDRPIYSTATDEWTTEPKLVSLTKGSWSYEATYKLNKVTNYTTQSLVRLDMSSSIDNTTSPFLNVLVYSGSQWASDEFKLRLLMSVSGSTTMLVGDNVTPEHDVDIELPGLNFYEGDQWHVAVTSQADPALDKALISLTATNANGSRIYTHKTTGSYYTMDDHHPLRAYKKTDGDGTPPATDNTGSIPFLAIGKYSGYQNKYLGSGSVTEFNGDVTSIRFWSKALTKNEIKDHALNPFSIGSADPIVNSPFAKMDKPALGVTGSHIDPIVNSDGHVNVNSGSWERLRVIGDVIGDITASDASGNSKVIDLSQNAYHFGIINAGANSQFVNPKFINYSTIETNWDSPSITNKIRIRSLADEEKAAHHGAHHGYLANLDPREIPVDDKRFSIEASVAQAINEDIANVISDLLFLNNSVGAPELLFAVNYPDLDALADKYFNRLQDKVDFRNYFEFFKWFDTTFSKMVENLIPSTTEFLGVNFVIESHALERHKLQYQQADVHIDLSRRLAARIDDVIGGTIVRTS